MKEKIKIKFKNCTLNGTPFTWCVTNGAWSVSKWNVVDTNTNKEAIYIFGTDGMDATLYNKNDSNFKLTDLVLDTLIGHLEKSPDDFKTGLFRFEFDGNQFNFCESKPKWANYDCGIIND